jgi:hypothetical protein
VSRTSRQYTLLYKFIRTYYCIHLTSHCLDGVLLPYLGYLVLDIEVSISVFWVVFRYICLVKIKLHLFYYMWCIRWSTFVSEFRNRSFGIFSLACLCVQCWKQSLQWFASYVYSLSLFIEDNRLCVSVIYVFFSSIDWNIEFSLPGLFGVFFYRQYSLAYRLGFLCLG